MCEASAYMIQDGQETLVLESVDIVGPLDEDGEEHAVPIYAALCGLNSSTKLDIQKMNTMNAIKGGWR